MTSANWAKMCVESMMDAMLLQLMKEDETGYEASREECRQYIEKKKEDLAGKKEYFLGMLDVYDHLSFEMKAGVLSPKSVFRAADKLIELYNEGVSGKA